MDEDFEPEIFGPRGGLLPPDTTHCDVPLKFTKQRAALLKPAPGQKIPRKNRYRDELRQIEALNGKVTYKGFELSKCQRDLLNFIDPPNNPYINYEWDQQLRVGSEIWDLNMKSLCDTTNLKVDIAKPDLTSKERRYLKKYFYIRAFWEEGCLMSGSSNYKKGFWWKKTPDGISYFNEGEFHIFASANLIVVRSPGGNYLASRDHLLILSDLASQRYLLRFLAILESKKPRNDFLTLKDLNKLIDNGDLILKRSGNPSYKYIYTLEPVCVSFLVGDIPINPETKETFYNTMKKETCELASTFQIQDLHQERYQLLSELSSNACALAQTYGLYRIWGHPTLEPLDAACALKSIATTVRGVNMDLAEEITNKFKEEFITRYIKTENKWPILDLSDLSPFNPIVEAYNSKGLYPKNHLQYKRSSLSLVKFKQLFPIDPKFDLIEMIADKAMSLLTPDLFQKITQQGGVGDSIERSVLVQWLKSDLHDPKEFLEFIDCYGFTLNEKSFGVKEKEREGKVEARLFGLMTLFKRMYIVLTEALLAEHILNLFPEITMTDDELSLDKKRLQFNDPKLHKRALFTSLDFSKWNSNMREAETLGIFDMFDQTFGFQNCFKRTHEMFKDSYVYLLNGSYTPSVEGNNFKTDLGSWRGHLGGIEGLRQKGWTLWTVALILLVAEKYPMTLRLMGQGDNQVLREIFPEDISEERQLEIHHQFMTDLESTLSKIGPPLKMEETWTSRTLYIYGKYLIYRGSPLPLYGKRVCRMFRLSNEDYPTIESTISSLTANLSAAVSQSYDPGYLFYLYLIELTGVYQLFLRSSYLQPKPPFEILSKSSILIVPGETRRTLISCPPFLKNQLVQDDSLFLKLILLPRALGGFPTSNIFNLLLRGFPDEVSFAISCLKRFYHHASPFIKLFISRILNPPLNPNINYTLLLDHPTSLNLQVPPTPSEARRNAVIKFLKSSWRVQNTFLKTFLQLTNDKNEQMLIEYLSTAVPFNPRILSLIASSTIEARARHIANKLQKTKTVSRLARQEGEDDIYSLIAKSELNHLTSVLRLCSVSSLGTFPWNPTMCSVDHASLLRNKGWNRDIVGVSCVPPQEFLYIESSSAIQDCSERFELEKGYVAVRFAQGLSSSIALDPLVPGPFKPYRGSFTRQKTVGFGEKLSIQADPLLQKILKAFNLVGWGVTPDGNLALLLKMLLEARTDLDGSMLMPDEASLTGSTHHRLQDPRIGHGGSVTILPNFSTYFGFDTFPLTAYSKGSKNVNLMFQSIMSYSTVIVSWALSTKWTPFINSLHIHVLESCCVKEIDDSLIDCPTVPPPCIFEYKDSPYLYIKADTFLDSFQNKLLIKPDAPLGNDPEEIQNRLLCIVSEEIFSILTPHSWDIPLYTTPTFNLVINWCLRLPLLSCLEYLVLKLCTHYINAIRKSDLTSFLLRLAARIDRSPLVYWTQLSNLLFCPNFSHELVKTPYNSIISGNPCLDSEICGQNLRGVCKQICLVWASEPNTTQCLQGLEIFASSQCGVNQHPAVLTLVRDFLTGKSIPNIIDIKYRITKYLSLEKPLDTDMPLDNLALGYIYRSKGKIIRETADVLCKKAPEIPPLPSAVTPIVPILPRAAHLLFNFERQHLIRSELQVFPIEYEKFMKYDIHGYRILSIPTSGYYKLLSLLNSLKIDVETAVCLGDGGGGFTWTILRYYPKSKVFYNSLITSATGIEQAPPIPYLPALAGWPGMEYRVFGLDATNNTLSDITHDHYPDLIAKVILGRKVDLLVCDAETPDYLQGETGIKLIKSIVDIGTRNNINKLIVKTYALNPSLFRAQISTALNNYSSVKVFRSDFSSNNNTEVYLYITELSRCLELVIRGTIASGLIVSPGLNPMIQAIKDSCLLGGSSITYDVADAYTGIVSDKVESVLWKQAVPFIPFLFSKKGIIYPHSLLEWIYDTCTAKRGHPRAHRIKLETQTLSTKLLEQFSIAWIVLAVWTGCLLIDDIEEFVSIGRIIWIPLLNQEWELVLSRSTPPPELQGPVYLVWDLSRILTGKHLKIVHKLIGICATFNYRPSKFSDSIERGGLSRHGTLIRSDRLPVDTWAIDNIYLTVPLANIRRESTGETVTHIWEQRSKRRRTIR